MSVRDGLGIYLHHPSYHTTCREKVNQNKQHAPSLATGNGRTDKTKHGQNAANVSPPLPVTRTAGWPKTLHLVTTRPYPEPQFRALLTLCEFILELFNCESFLRQILLNRFRLHDGQSLVMCRVLQTTALISSDY